MPTLELFGLAKTELGKNSATASEIAAGTTSNAAYTSLSGVFSPFVGKTGGTSSNDPHDANFGQDPSFANTLTGGDVGTAVGGGGTWKYAPPAGFKALNATNLSEPDSVSSPRNDSIENSYFYTVLYDRRVFNKDTPIFSRKHQCSFIPKCIPYLLERSFTRIKLWLILRSQQQT